MSPHTFGLVQNRPWGKGHWQYWTDLLVWSRRYNGQNVWNICRQQRLTLTLSKKPFRELLRCADLEPDPILIVAVANSHYKEKDTRNIPKHGIYYMLMLPFQDPPQIVLPFSYTNMNMYLGKILRNKDYGKSMKAKTPFDDFIEKNVNQKLPPPIQKKPGRNSVQWQLSLSRAFTITRTSAASHSKN